VDSGLLTTKLFSLSIIPYQLSPRKTLSPTLPFLQTWNRAPSRACVQHTLQIHPPHVDSIMGKVRILAEFWQFLRVRKKYWLAPIVIVLVLLSLLIVMTQGSALAPFIYALF